MLNLYFEIVFESHGIISVFGLLLVAVMRVIVRLVAELHYTREVFKF